MTTPLSSFSGMISGFNYRDLVDAIIAQEARPADRLRSQISANDKKVAALGTYRGLLESLKTAATKLRDGSAFDARTATVTATVGTKPLVTASASAEATPGSFRIEVTSLARAQKLGSAAQADASAELGLAGTFTIGGKEITIEAGDTLVEIRDRINAANSGDAATKVSATILSVGTTDHRLVLTSDAAGAAGIALDDTTGTVLESLGLLATDGTVPAGAVLVAGSDAVFEIDNIPFTRTTNTVSDAIEGVTLTLQATETDAVTTVVVDRNLESARGAAQSFVDGYNKLVDFIKQQSKASDTSRQPLYNESVLTTLRSSLPQALLSTIDGAASGLDTAASAGLSLTRDGKLSLDAAKFDEAFTTRHADLRTLFTEHRSASDDEISFSSASRSTAGGTYAVEITQPATQPRLASSGFSGTYADGGTPDSLTITDDLSKQSVTVELSSGMTTADIVAAINTAAGDAGLRISATESGTEIELTHATYGSAAGITVANATGAEGGSELWAASTTVSGLDVAGTIGGHAATGSGQQLVGNTGTSAAGLSVRYTGSTARSAGDVTLQVGAGALIERLLTSYVEANTGALASKEAQLTAQSASLDTRATAIDGRLERRRAYLLARFVQMEMSISRLQQQSSSLISLNKPQE